MTKNVFLQNGRKHNVPVNGIRTIHLSFYYILGMAIA